MKKIIKLFCVIAFYSLPALGTIVEISFEKRAQVAEIIEMTIESETATLNAIIHEILEQVPFSFVLKTPMIFYESKIIKSDEELRGILKDKEKVEFSAQTLTQLAQPIADKIQHDQQRYTDTDLLVFSLDGAVSPNSFFTNNIESFTFSKDEDFIGKNLHELTPKIYDERPPKLNAFTPFDENKLNDPSVRIYVNGQLKDNNFLIDNKTKIIFVEKIVFLDRTGWDPPKPMSKGTFRGQSLITPRNTMLMVFTLTLLTQLTKKGRKISSSAWQKFKRSVGLQQEKQPETEPKLFDDNEL